MGRLDGKVAIVTGAGSGIGQAAARLFASQGAKVVAFDKSPSVHETAAGINATNGEAEAIIGDAGSETDVADLVTRAIATFGKLDVFWANAGIDGGWAKLHDQTVDMWNEVLRVNLVGSFLAVKYASAEMIRGSTGGSIILTASVAGLRGNAAAIPYSASKAGVINLAQTASCALAGTGIRVNAICPGLIETGLTRDLFEDARARGKADRIGKINPSQRGGQPDEIAATGLFLASDEASYVNGQALPVDGGLTASLPHPGRFIG